MGGVDPRHASDSRWLSRRAVCVHAALQVIRAGCLDMPFANVIPVEQMIKKEI